MKSKPSFADGRALAIVNPSAGGGKAARRTRELLRIFGEERAKVDLVRTPGPGDAARLAHDAAEDGYRRVIAVGGDGTVHEVANGLFGTDVELAIVPLGGANDFAAALGLRDWRAAARAAVRAPARPVDALVANGRVAVNCVGVGVDARGARALVSHRRYLGSFAYLTAAVATLLSWRPQPLVVELDGERIEGRHLLAVAANGPRFANGMQVAPGAAVDDGLFDICLVGDTNVAESLFLLQRVYSGRHVGHAKVRLVRARRVVIEQEGAGPVQLDGEVAEEERLEIECVPRALRVVAP